MNRRAFLAAAAAAAAAVTSAAPVLKPRTVYDLLCVEHLPDKKGGGRNRLWRVKVAEPDKPVEVVTLPSRSESDCYGWQLHPQQLVLTRCAQVIELETGEVLHDPADSFLLEPDGNRIVYRIRQGGRDNNLFAFDLTKRTVVQPASPHRWELDGIVSPGGTRSITREVPKKLLDPGMEFILHSLDGSRTSLGTNFSYTALGQSLDLRSLGIGAPILWIDENRILTQIDNGRLLTVDVTTGKRGEEILAPSSTHIGGPPSLWRDAEGAIVYRAGAGLHHIDVKAGKSEPYEWQQLGHGFEASAEQDRDTGYAFRHDRRLIGERFGHDEVTCPGHIALLVGRETVTVWAADGGRWLTPKVTADTLVGWVKG